MSKAVSVEITVINFSHNKRKTIASAINLEWPCEISGIIRLYRMSRYRCYLAEVMETFILTLSF